MLIKDCLELKAIKQKILDETLDKILHLWHLNPETAAMSIFDDKVSLDVKRKIMLSFFVENEDDEQKSDEDEDEEEKKNIDEREDEDDKEEERFKKLQVPIFKVPNLIKKDFSSFVSRKSMKFFEIFNLPTKWMQEDSKN